MASDSATQDHTKLIKFFLTKQPERLEDLFNEGVLDRPSELSQNKPNPQNKPKPPPQKTYTQPQYPPSPSPLMIVDEDYMTEEDEGDTEEDGDLLVQSFQSRVSIIPSEAKQLQTMFDKFLLKINILLDINQVKNLQSRNAYRQIIFNQLLSNDYSHVIKTSKLPKQ